ncbi:hypothetical protein CLAIMM_03925 [Cladophialophora immunda]|nr:hypothetical protein CLAIMM_03925 [Cladophialophora immunda]
MYVRACVSPKTLLLQHPPERTRHRVQGKVASRFWRADASAVLSSNKVEQSLACVMPMSTCESSGQCSCSAELKPQVRVGGMPSTLSAIKYSLYLLRNLGLCLTRYDYFSLLHTCAH